MTTLTEVLGKYAPDIDEDDFLDDLQSKLAAVHSDSALGLTHGELDFLTDHGGPAARDVLEQWDSPDQGRQRLRLAASSVQTVWASTVSAAAAAALMKKDRSQVSRDLSRQRLYGIRVGAKWRIPRWQFVDGAMLPGLDVIVPAIPVTVHPTAVEGFMATAQDELDHRSPLEHLRAGGDPAVVKDLIDGLDR